MIKKKKIRRKEVKRRNKKIILSSLLIVCLLAVGYGAFQTTISISTTGRTVVDERCVVENVFNFEQKDEIQEFKVPCSGTYKLETWGANGGTQTSGGYGRYIGKFGEGAFFNCSGGGGSGYIGNASLTDKAMYCYDCEKSLDLNHPEIFTISTTGDTNYKDTLNCPNGYDENPVSKCAKKGDGYARITLISKK